MGKILDGPGDVNIAHLNINMRNIFIRLAVAGDGCAEEQYGGNEKRNIKAV
jgi:hypothetical protein